MREEEATATTNGEVNARAGDVENPAAEGGKRSARWAYLDKVPGLMALGLSIASFIISNRASTDIARIDALKTQYSAFSDLAKTQLQFPLMSHLFSVSNRAYDSDVLRIRAAVKGCSPRELATYSAQEKATAHYIFVAYEQTYYMWRQSANSNDQERKTQLSDDLYYFNTAFGNNPRILWFWDLANGGRLSQAFATELRDYYKQNVSSNSTVDADPAGPFAAAE